MARDRFRYFRIEARELLEHLGRGVLELEKSPPADLVPRLLRLAHTLKGAARVVRQQDVADRAHAVEDVLAALRESAAPAPRDGIDHLLRLLDDIGDRVATLTPLPAPGAGSPGGGEPEEVFRAFRPETHEMDGLLDTMSEAQGQVAALHPLVNRVERARHLAGLVLDQLDSPGLSDGRPGDRAMNRRARSVAEELHTVMSALERELGDRVDHIGREMREARSAAERLRLVPASAVFTLLERTARDAAQALGKRVVFEGRGGDVRLDAQVLGAVQKALVQVVRNAVAHGIEPPADRTAREKAPEGRVTIDVVRRGRSVVFSCTDDGCGIDLDAIRRAARLKNLSPAAAEMSTVDDVLALLLKGGISTSGTVTDVSGRGIGLDVVREVAERLGGDVAVRTGAQRGTTIDLVVPLSLSSFAGVLVEALGVTAVVPLDAVRGILRLTPEAVVRMAHAQSMVHDGQAIPLGSLARALVRDVSPMRTSGPSSVLVVRGRSSTAAFSVDRVVGVADVVFRPLPDLAPAAPFVVGAAMGAEGAPQLVLDPDALVAGAERFVSADDAPAAARPAVLVVDDSLTTRMLEQSILESAGYMVDLAVSGEEALEKARDRRYALFLVDVEMPGMDGFTFIERARADPALRDIPPILVTSRSAPDDRRRGEKAGARAYVTKSEFDQNALLEHIRRLVG